MSFSKAKINRYYDQQTCAPPPGTYDPKLEAKVKGAIIEQGKRFSDPMRLSSTSSLESLDSTTSMSSQIFRTPSMRKKISFSNRTGSCNRTPSKARLNLHRGDENLMEQLMEKNEEVKSLISQINLLNEKINILSSSHKVELQNATSEQEEEVNNLKKSLIEMRSRLESEKINYNEKLGEMKSQFLRMEENMSNFMTANQRLEESLVVKESMCQELGQILTDMTSNYGGQLEKFRKTYSNLEDVNRKIMHEYESLIEDFDQEKLKSIDYKICMAKLQDRLEAIQDDISQANNRCRLYEVIQKETSKTVNVLTERLIESEDEIEHLSKVRKELLCNKEKLEQEKVMLAEENRRIKESIDFLQQDVVQEVQKIQSHLMAKLEVYKKVAQEENLKLLSCLEEKQNAIDLMLTEIDCYNVQKQEFDKELSYCHSVIKDYKFQVSMLEDNATELEKDFEEKISAQRALFCHLSKEYDDLKKTFDEEKAELEKHISQLSSENKLLETECLREKDDNALLNQKVDVLQREIDLAVSTIREVIKKFGEPHIEDMGTLRRHLEKLSDISSKHTEKLKRFTEENEVIFRQRQILEEISGDKDNKIEVLKSQLEEYKVYAQSLNDHVVSLINEAAEKEKKISMYMSDIEIINATLIQVSEEYDNMKRLHEAEVKHVEEVERDMMEMQSTHQGYMDEVISELVLEKERVSELSVTVDNIRTDKMALEEKLSTLNNKSCSVNEDKSSAKVPQLKRKIKHLDSLLAELAEKVQIFEYERIAQEFLIDELMAHGDDLLGVITRQNNEIEALSESADDHFAQVHNLTAKEKDFVSEIDALKTQLNVTKCQMDLCKNELISTNFDKDRLAKEVEQLKNKCDTVSTDLAEKDAALKSAHDQMDMATKELCQEIDQSKLKYDAMLKRKDEYKKYSLKLEEEIKKIKNLLEEKELLLMNSNEQSMRVTSLEAEIADLHCRNKELTDMIEPFKEQFMKFEQEKKLLLSKNENTEKELKAVILQRAEALGHQNHKQKIKHVVNLHETIANLKKENEKYRKECIKLRKELMLKAQNPKKKPNENKKKENNENRTENKDIVPPKSRLENTASPGNALKDKN